MQDDPTHHTHSSMPDEPRLADLVPRPFDWKVVGLLTLTCVVLTGSAYWARFDRADKARQDVLAAVGLDHAERQLAADDAQPPTWTKRMFLRIAAFSDRCANDLRHGPNSQLHKLQYWCGSLFAFYFILPALFIRLVLREHLRDYGLKLQGWYRGAWVYAVAFGIVFPLVWWFGKTAGFMKMYPFYKMAGRSWGDFLAWEAAYAAQFFAVEFFFRGVLVHGLKHRFGVYSIFVMTIPYTMIHFGKPAPETFGAIIAGVFLGGLSLWTRSVWMGVLIHVSVAVSMDIVALRNSGRWEVF
jgi:membrane protease YdiL (CAAX protease family)